MDMSQTTVVPESMTGSPNKPFSSIQAGAPRISPTCSAASSTESDSTCLRAVSHRYPWDSGMDRVFFDAQWEITTREIDDKLSAG